MAERKKKTPPKIEIKTRTPKKKDADIFADLGKKKKSSIKEVHPIKELIDDAQPTQPNPTYFP